MEDNELIKTFGTIIKVSQETALDMLANYKKDPNFTKKPDDYQKALIDLIQTLDQTQFYNLQKGIKYCLDLSFFKLIDLIENGKGDLKFKLSIINKNQELSLVGDNKDNELIYKFWDWVEE